jgi:hypothetical protein
MLTVDLLLNLDLISGSYVSACASYKSRASSNLAEFLGFKIIHLWIELFWSRPIPEHLILISYVMFIFITAQINVSLTLGYFYYQFW